MVVLDVARVERCIECRSMRRTRRHGARSNEREIERHYFSMNSCTAFAKPSLSFDVVT
jgi:hypothetical protein